MLAQYIRMLEIILLLLFATTEINGDDISCQCSCEGTKQYEEALKCDKITGKCECKHGFTGNNCETCIERNPANNICKTCDCSLAKNQCKNTSKFKDLLHKFNKIKDIKYNTHPEINLKDVNQLKLKVDGLFDRIKKKKQFDLTKLEKNVKNIETNINELHKKYTNEDLPKEDADKLKEAKQKLKNILDVVDEGQDQERIKQIADQVGEIIEQIDDILKNHKICLDVVDQFCSGKDINQLLKELGIEMKEIDLEKFMTRLRTVTNNIEKTNDVNDKNNKTLHDVEIPIIYTFNQKLYKENHGLLNDINNRTNDIHKKTNLIDDLYKKAKQKKEESNLLKEMTINTILMAPVPEIQEIIDNITNTVIDAKKIIDGIDMNELKNSMQKLLQEVKTREEELTNLNKSKMVIYEKAENITQKIIQELKSNIQNLTDEYNKKIEEYKNLNKKIEDDFSKIQMKIEEDIESMTEMAKNVNEKVDANNEIIDELNENSSHVENVLENIETVTEEIKSIEKIVKYINQIPDVVDEDTTKLICPKHDLQ